MNTSLKGKLRMLAAVLCLATTAAAQAPDDWANFARFEQENAAQTTAPRAVRHHGDGPVRGDEGVSRMSNAARSIAAAGAALGGRTIRRVILASAAILLAIWEP